jgi:hypothetical protein
MQEEMSDHDALITLIGEVRALRDDVKSLRDNYKEQLADHETRLRFLEKWAWGAIAVLAAFQFLVIAYVQYHK